MGHSLHGLSFKLKEMEEGEFAKMMKLLAGGGFGEIARVLDSVRDSYHPVVKEFGADDFTKGALALFGKNSAELEEIIGVGTIASAIAELNGGSRNEAISALEQATDFDFSPSSYDSIEKDIDATSVEIMAEQPEILAGTLRAAARKAAELGGGEMYDHMKAMFSHIVAKGFCGSFVGGKTGVSPEQFASILPDEKVRIEDERGVAEFIRLLGVMGDDLNRSDGADRERIATHKRLLNAFDVSGVVSDDMSRALMGYSAQLAAHMAGLDAKTNEGEASQEPWL